MTKRRVLFFVFVLAITPTLAFAALGEKSTPPARASVSATAVQWVDVIDHESAVLTVQSPNGDVTQTDFSGGRAAMIRMQDLGKNPADGEYTYELRLIPHISSAVKEQLRAAREANDDAAIARIQHANGLDREFVQSGSFVLMNGSFVNGERLEGGAPPKRTPTASATSTPIGRTPTVQDVVTADDAIIQGSLCVGLDCVNNESFGFDTIRLKENNTRIKFDDTSTTAGCPNNDWQLTANDACGGSNKFSIEDITGSKVPFTLTAGAPSNSIFVASSGKVGFGNNSPGLNLHITTTDTPAIRQEQTNGGGFTAQTWDIGANEANWFVRDLTGGSRLPLRIRPGAPTSSVDVAASGNVGMGTASPQLKLHVFSTATTDSNLGLGPEPGNTSSGVGPGLNMGYSGASLGRGACFINSRADSGSAAPNPSLRFWTNDVQRVIIDNDGNIGIGVADPTDAINHSSGAKLTAGGVWTNASSRDKKQDIFDVTSEEAAAALKDLTPVHYTYKVDTNEKHVGFIAEDVPEIVATPDRKSLSPMDVVAVLTKVVKDQQKTIDQLSARIDQLESSKQPK